MAERTRERSTTDAAPAAPPAGPAVPVPPGPAPHPYGRLRILAALLGGLGTVLALAFPFLPVVQDTATITWPSPTTGTRSVDAPLVAYRPQSMSVSVPCAAIQSLDGRSAQPATVLSTTPPLSPQGTQVGMRLSVADGQLTLNSRGLQTASGPVPRGACTVSVTADDTRTVVDLGSRQAVTTEGDSRPQVVGIYSDLDAARDPTAGVAVSVTPDTRFQTSPTVLKLAAGALAILAAGGAVWALHGLDVRAGRRPPRRSGRRRWVPTGRDVAVTVVLVVWAVIGSQTSDDGYILGIARARGSAGYIGNFYRWFNVPEAPFGWFYEFYAVWARISDAVLWLRLPALALGLASWVLISRGMLPRLGPQVRRSAAASWAAAGVFLMFWLPYNNGLRPEPVDVLAGLVAFLAVERAVATRRLAPVAFGLVAAAFALAATPTGLMAVAPFLAAARPLVRLAQERTRAAGRLPVLLPVAAAAAVVLVAVFADQTYAAVSEASRVRFVIGPDLQWFDEIIRYQRLFSDQADGSLARRAPVLLLVLGLVTCLTVLLRRDRIRGAALGPAQRLIGSTLLGFLVLALTPTKWTHHFGAFAALGAGMAALTALATSSEMLRSRRNRSLFLGAVFATLALAFAGPNTWWYTNDWGVPWFDKPVSYQGYQLSTAAIVVAAAFLASATVIHIRRPRPPGIPGPPPTRAGRWRRQVLDQALGRTGPMRRVRGTSAGSAAERRARALRQRSAPIAIITGLLVLFEVASLAKGADKQQSSFSLGSDVATHPFGGSCGLADHVMLEGSPLAGVLPPAPSPSGFAPSAPGVLPTIAPPAAPAAPGSPVVPLPPDVYPASSPQAELVDPFPGDGGFHHEAAVPPTGGSSGVSGYEYTLRNDLASDTLGTFDPSGAATGVLRTSWSALDDDLRTGRTPLVVTAAGRLGSGNLLTVQYARRLPDGRVQVLGSQDVDDGATDERGWREFRIDLSGTVGARADEVRLIAQDRALGADGWLAVAPVRAPQLVPLTAVAGNGPGFLEWPVQFASPCLRPFDVRDGIAEVPGYRLIADPGQFREGGESWSEGSAGGPLGWIDVLERPVDVPSYLRGQESRDWGTFQRLEPYAPTTVAPTVVHGERELWGATTQGRIGDPPPGVPSPER